MHTGQGGNSNSSGNRNRNGEGNMSNNNISNSHIYNSNDKLQLPQFYEADPGSWNRTLGPCPILPPAPSSSPLLPRPSSKFAAF